MWWGARSTFLYSVFNISHLQYTVKHKGDICGAQNESKVFFSFVSLCICLRKGAPHCMPSKQAPATIHIAHNVMCCKAPTHKQNDENDDIRHFLIILILVLADHHFTIIKNVFSSRLWSLYF